MPPSGWLLPLLILLPSCKAHRAGAGAGGETALEVQLEDPSGNFEATGQHLYQLSECGEEPATGIPGYDNKVLFRLAGISAGQKCRIEVLDPDLMENEDRRWLSGTSGAVLWTKNLALVEEGPRGRLTATAVLSPGTSPSTEPDGSAISLSLQVEFAFPGGEPEDPAWLSATLTCVPPMAASGRIHNLNGPKAEVLFFQTDAGSIPGSPLRCSRLTVFREGELAYQGPVRMDAPVTPVAGIMVPLAARPVMLRPIAGPDRGDSPGGLRLDFDQKKCPKGEVVEPDDDRCVKSAF